MEFEAPELQFADIAVSTIASCASATAELPSPGERRHQQQLWPADCIRAAGICPALGNGTLFQHRSRVVRPGNEQCSNGWRIPVYHNGFGRRWAAREHPSLAAD